MTTDYTAQATTLLAKAKLVPHPEDDPPGYEVDLIDEINATIGVAADSEDEARAKVVDHVADMLRARDPDYVPEPPPTAADHVLDALDSLPAGSTVDDAITAVKSSLVDAGATTTAVAAARTV